MTDDQLIDMSSEYARMASFRENSMDVAAVMSTSSTTLGCWNLRYNSPMKCAQSGFYCVPETNGNVMRCFACSAEWTNAAGESPLAVHRALNPNCPYLKSATPFSTPAPLIIPKNHINDVRRCLFSSDNEDTNFTTENNEYLCKFEFHNQLKNNFIFTPIGGPDFLFESRRFLSFDNLSNHSEYMSKVSELAADGFIFRQTDMVQCVFCGLALSFTTELSKCKMQHQQDAPHCPLVLKEDVGNVTLEMENAVNWMKEQTFSMEMSPVFVHPQFEEDTKRLDTFREWSPQMYQKPEQLCQAGFYYTGCADKVVCFCCGLALKTWRDLADPWVQHARLSPRCAHVQQVKGNNFVQDAQHAEVQADFDPPKAFQEGPVSSDGSVTTTSPVRPGLDLNVIKAALECQYSMAQIRQAILKIHSLYCGFPNFALLMGELLAEDASQKMLLDLLRERQEKERERQEKEREILRGQQLEEEKERERQEKERERLRGQQLEEENERERQEKERERLRGQQLEEENERERQERLQLEQAQQQMYASILRMSLEKQNWQDRLRQEEERRRQEEERRRREEERHVTELSRQEEELQRLRAEIIRLKQEQAPQNVQNVAANPQGIVANPQGIAANPQGVAANPPGVAANPQGIAANPQGIAANPQGVAANPQGIAANLQEVAANSQGIAANPQGVAANTPGVAANPQGFASNPQGFAANPQGIAADPQGIAANLQGIAADPQGIAANPQGIAADPPLPLANLAAQCITCLQEPATALFLPCRHLCCGVQCSQHFLRNPCPMCRQVVMERMIVFVA